MPEFKYRASDAAGKIRTGKIDAADAKTAALGLSASGLTPLSVRATATQATKSEKTPKKSGGEKSALALVKKLKQLCGGGGMPVGDALKSLSVRSLDPRVKGLARELYAELSEGKTLAAAMSKRPETFDASVVHLVEAGESTANLGFVFDNIIEYIEERDKLRATIVSALAYPAFLCATASAVVLMFLFFMLPRIKSMMANMGAPENFAIKMMNFIGDALTVGVPAFVFAAGAAVVALKFYGKTPAGRAKIDANILKTPIIGKIAFDADICRISKLAATLFASGVNATETFRLAEKTISNAELAARFRQFRTAVNDGAPISAALQKFGLLDDEDVDVVAVGERTGSLVSAFGELASAHSASLGRRIKTATSALGGLALGTAFLLIFTFAAGIVTSILGLSQGLVAK